MGVGVVLPPSPSDTLSPSVASGPHLTYIAYALITLLKCVTLLAFWPGPCLLG